MFFLPVLINLNWAAQASATVDTGLDPAYHRLFHLHTHTARVP